MKISRNKKNFQINFDSSNDVNNNLDKQEQKDIIDKFLQPCPYFQFNAIENQEIQKFKKKVIGSANQYGTRNQKTTAIFLSFLQTTRDLGTAQLKKKDYMSACSFYSMCLGFIDPDDEVFLEKFIVTKIDILNKLMFCLFQMKNDKFQNKNLESALSYLEQFLQKSKKFAFESNLVKSDICMMELNYFYLARIFKKRKNYQKAIQSFLKAQQIIVEKRTFEVYDKNPSLNSFSKNLEIKIFYKISKCYREDETTEEQQIFQGRALKQAEKYNQYLYQYISKKIRMYKSSKLFNEKLSKLEGKKKIQEEVLRYIEQCSQRECSSLYDVYKDRPRGYIQPI